MRTSVVTLTVFVFLLIAFPAYAQEPICTGPGAAEWQHAGEMDSPKVKFRPAVNAGHLLVPRGAQLERLAAGQQAIPAAPVALQPNIDRGDGYTLHIQGNHGYLIGGSTVTTTVEYATVNPALFGPWRATAATANQWQNPVVVSSDSYIYVLGGTILEMAAITPNGSLLGNWQSWSIPYRESFAAALAGDTLYIVGGDDDLGTLPGSLRGVSYTHLTIDGTPGAWVNGPALLQRRYGPEAIVIGDYLYVIGGEDLTSDNNPGGDLVERAKINADGSIGAWEIVTRITRPRREFGLARAGNLVFAMGGRSTDPETPTLPIADIEVWDTSKPFPPTDFGLTINDGALFTNQVTTTLTIGLAAPFTQLVQVSNDGGFAGAVWQTYQPCKSWQITQYGSSIIPRTVYVRFKDAAGQLSATFQDDIILDVTPPEGAVIIEELQPAGIARAESVTVTQEATYTVHVTVVMKDGAEPNVTLILAASDDVSGVAEMRVSTEPGGGAWQAYRESVPWYLEDGGRVYAQFRDYAGNESKVVSAGR